LSLVYALSAAAAFNLFYRDGYKVQELAESAITLATEHDFPFWVANATIRRGGALVMQGQSTEGLKQIQEGQEARRATGSEPKRPSSTVFLAEAHWQAGQVEDGLRVLIETVAMIKQTREGFYEPELYRLKGELLLSQSLGNPSEAESCFHQALEVSRSQQAKSLELRAATSLAKLWQSQGKREEARALLSEIYGWFTEGFDTADLIDARAMLDELSSASRT
jgi:predicted ATPase